MKEIKLDCQQGSHYRYQPYSKLPSKQVLEELTHEYPDLDLSKLPIKGGMGEILQILFAMVMYETLNNEGPLISEPHLQQSTPHLNISNISKQERPMEDNKQFPNQNNPSLYSTNSTACAYIKELANEKTNCLMLEGSPSTSCMPVCAQSTQPQQEQKTQGHSEKSEESELGEATN